MIPSFDDFATPLSEVAPLSELDGAVVAIEASHYLGRLLMNPSSKEPLLAALGGLPFTMRTTVQNEIAAFRDANIKPIFVFDGLDVSKTKAVFQQADEAVRANTTAWSLYNQHQAENAVTAFGESCAVTAESFYRYFQLLLQELGVEFQIAPYSALAQLAYLEQRGTDFVDAVSGSHELLLFDVDKVITRLDPQQGDFMWLTRRACLEGLGNVPSDVFVDACMLSGSAFLPTLPQLEANNSRKPTKIKAALDLMNSFGRSGINVCLHYQDDPQFRQMDYLDRYRRSRLAVKHHAILTKDGKIELFDQTSAPGDSHEFIGQRLPDEVYFYMSKGLVGPRVLNWRTIGEIAQGPPLDNGDSNDYQRFVRSQIIPLRFLRVGM
ncbi:PIN domain-like protein [Viridothelium virens]|uniref:PIN domain-like protein n=1 Tax=Viridothelium virens TaxID=1048519 RepID=A0A6A6HM29_VIRVR|nr:PIN domain-like protein [Viridothelium virens]